MGALTARVAARSPQASRTPAPQRSLAPVRSAPAPVRASAAADPRFSAVLQLRSALQVSSPSDPAEREAEATADAVLAMPAATTAIAPTANTNLARRPAALLVARAPAPVAGAIVQCRSSDARSAPAGVEAGIRSSAGGGAPLPANVRSFMEPRFGADFSAVRIHTGAQAARLSNRLSAQAFTVGHQIFFAGGQYRPDTREGRHLLAHELTHTIQQGSVVQRRVGPDISQRTAPQVQRLGVQDALDYFADKANLIPGFRMFTIVLGVNPVNMSPVERSAANILRAVVEFLPGGGLVTQALDQYGVFDRVGGWIEQQLQTLGLTGSAIKQAIGRFLDSLSWTDIFNLGGVWERAKALLTDPIDRIKRLVVSLGGAVLQFIKDAILRPLAELAAKAPGWDLLCAVLGRNPITGDSVARDAETLIGGFMKLIGQEEIWENIKKGNAVARAFAWFQTALSGLMAFVQRIPGLFLETLQSLEIADLVLLPRAYIKVGKAFGGFLAEFIGWAGGTIWDLLEIIVSVVAPSVLVYLRRAAGAFKKILEDPIGFVGNLVRAGKQGLTQFAGNIVGHLQGALLDWLTAALGGAAIYVPRALTLVEIGKTALSVLGISWPNIRAKFVKALGPAGETIMKTLETGFDIVVALVKGGPAAAWELIKDKLADLRDVVISAIVDFVKARVVTVAVAKITAMFVPGAGFIQAIVTAYDAIMVFVQRLKQLAAVVAAFIDSIAAIANGQIGAAAGRVERVMAGLLSLVIAFLARFAGVDKVTDRVIEKIKALQAKVDQALDKAVASVVARAKAFTASRPGGGRDGARGKDVERSLTFARERHVVRAHIDRSRLQAQMSSARFMPVDEELAHVRKHFVETYLPAVKRDADARTLLRDLETISAEKNAWEARYAAAPEAQKEVVVNDGMAQLIARFQTVNQKLETLIGPWAMVRVGDTISYTERNKTVFGTVTEIMYAVSSEFGIKARPAYESAKGRRVPKDQTEWYNRVVFTGPGLVLLMYSWYGSRWQRATGNLPLLPGSRERPFDLAWPKPAWSTYPVLYFGGLREKTPQSTLRALYGRDPTIRQFPPAGGTLGTKVIGIQDPYRIQVDSIVGPLTNRTTPGGGKLLTILRPFGFDSEDDGMQADHVHEIQLGGVDDVANLWPLGTSINASAGSTLANARAKLPDGGGGDVALRDLKRLSGIDFYFRIKSVR